MASDNEKEIVKAFAEQVKWVFTCWQMHKYLFEENSNDEVMKQDQFNHFFYHLSEIIADYSVIQICKLHDPEKSSGHDNLSLSKVMALAKHAQQYEEIKDIKKNLDDFFNKLKPARNKILAHADLKTVLNNETLGKFDSGEDKEYFSNLKRFMDVIFLHIFGENEPFIWDNLVQNDVEFFLAQFNSGRFNNSPHR